MADRNERKERAAGRRPEGVRIIGAEEAQKALDNGQAAGRRPEDELRYGDVPPAPSGPRPQHRFPLPDSVDPAAAVPRPPVAPIPSDAYPGRGPRSPRAVWSSQTGEDGGDEGAGPTGGPVESVTILTGDRARDAGAAAEARPGDQDAHDEPGEPGDHPAGGESETGTGWGVAVGGPAFDEHLTGLDPAANQADLPTGQVASVDPPYVDEDYVNAQYGDDEPGWEAEAAWAEPETANLRAATPTGDDPAADDGLLDPAGHPDETHAAGTAPGYEDEGAYQDTGLYDEPTGVYQAGAYDEEPVDDETAAAPPAASGWATADTDHPGGYRRAAGYEQAAGHEPGPATELAPGTAGDEADDEHAQWRRPAADPGEAPAGGAGGDQPGHWSDVPPLSGAGSAGYRALVEGAGYDPATYDPAVHTTASQQSGWADEPAVDPASGTHDPGHEAAGASESPVAPEGAGGGPGGDDPFGASTPDPAASPTPDPLGASTPDPAAAPTPDPLGAPTPDPTASPTPDLLGASTPDPATPDFPADDPLIPDPAVNAGPTEPADTPAGTSYEEDTAAVPATSGEPSDARTAGIPGSGGADPYAWGAMGDTSDDERTSITPQVPDEPQEPGDEGGAEAWQLGARPEEPLPLADELHVPDLAPPEEGITLTGSHQMPDWTEPASGEVPAALVDPSRPDDDEAWEALGRSARWRSTHDDWSDAADVDYLAGDEPATGALSSSDSERSDPYSFDEDFERLEEERSGTHQAVALDQGEGTGAHAAGAGDDSREAPRVVVGSGGSRTATHRPPTSNSTGTSHRTSRSGGEELPSRIAVGVGLIVLLVIAYALGPVALLVLAAAAVVAAAAETYGILQRSGFRPATLLGLVATAGLMFAGYWRGMDALGLILALTFAATMVWYLLGIVEARPLANVAVTSMAVLWVGFFGGFAGLILKAHDGRGLFLGLVAVTVISDIVAYLVGSQLGRRPLAPDISPGKTVEGLIAGTVAALVVGVLVGKELTAWASITDGVLLGVVVAVLAPIGDLFESLIKRDLNVKDSGTSLGGHGGMLDRFDSLLLVLPGAYFLANYLHLIK